VNKTENCDVCGSRLTAIRGVRHYPRCMLAVGFATEAENSGGYERVAQATPVRIARYFAMEVKLR